MAEFDFSTPPEPLETFPFNQAVPRWSMYFMKSNIVPIVYWQMLKYVFNTKHQKDLLFTRLLIGTKADHSDAIFWKHFTFLNTLNIPNYLNSWYFEKFISLKS